MLIDMEKKSERRGAKPRRYTLKRRAEKRDRTRERIVHAAMALHEELGPLETTITAVAERAGVQRLTVYRHFPSEQELFNACTSSWLELNPPPDPGSLRREDAEERTLEALTALYRYYRKTEGMWTSAYRDAARVPALHGPLAEFDAYLESIAADLLGRHAPSRAQRPRLAATLNHAVRFSTWRSLAEQKLSDTAITKLVTAWIRAC